MLRIADSRSAISTYALKPPSSSQVDLWDSTIKAADRIAAYRRFLDEVTLFMDNGYDDYTPEPTPEHTTPPTTASPDPTPTVIPTLSPTESPTTPAITPAPTATSAPKELDTVREEIKSGLTEDERQAIKAADLSDLQNAGDQFGSVLDPVLVNVISGTEANELADNICNGDNVNAAVDFGMGTSGKVMPSVAHPFKIPAS